MKVFLWLLAASVTACGSSQVAPEDFSERPSQDSNAPRQQSQPSGNIQDLSNEKTEEQREFEKNRQIAMAHLADDELDPCTGPDCATPVKNTPDPQTTQRSRAEQEAALQKLHQSLYDDGPIIGEETAQKDRNRGHDAQINSEKEALQVLALPSFATDDAPQRISQCIKNATLMTELLDQLRDSLNQLKDCAKTEEFLLKWADQEGQTLLNADDAGVALGLTELELFEPNIIDLFWQYRNSMQRSSQALQTLTCNMHLDSASLSVFRRIPVDLNHWVQPREQAQLLVVLGKMTTSIRSLNNKTVTAGNCPSLAQQLVDWSMSDGTQFLELNNERHFFGIDPVGPDMPEVTRKPAVRIQNAYREEVNRLMRRIRACKKNEQFKQDIRLGFTDIPIPESLSPDAE